MKVCLSLVAAMAFSIAALAEDCTNNDFGSFSEVQGSVQRLLSWPGYTSVDEKILNRSGDLAAVAILKAVAMDAMDTPEKIRQILLILRLAFAAPQLITACNQNPTTALLVLDHLQSSENGSQRKNEIENTRFLVKHASKGKPLPSPVGGEPKIDWDHTAWVDSVLRWIIEIKPGMTRRDLLRVFTTEGGMYFPLHRTYVLRQCPYIKVDVEFAPSISDPKLAAESPDDKIAKISRPYLEYSIMD